MSPCLPRRRVAALTLGLAAGLPLLVGALPSAVAQPASIKVR